MNKKRLITAVILLFAFFMTACGSEGSNKKEDSVSYSEINEVMASNFENSLEKYNSYKQIMTYYYPEGSQFVITYNYYRGDSGINYLFEAANGSLEAYWNGNMYYKDSEKTMTEVFYERTAEEFIAETIQSTRWEDEPLISKGRTITVRDAGDKKIYMITTPLTADNIGYYALWGALEGDNEMRSYTVNSDGMVEYFDINIVGVRNSLIPINRCTVEYDIPVEVPDFVKEFETKEKVTLTLKGMEGSSGMPEKTYEVPKESIVFIHSSFAGSLNEDGTEPLERNMMAEVTEDTTVYFNSEQ